MWENWGGVSIKQKLLIGNIGYQRRRDLHPNWRFSNLQLQDVFNFLTCFNCIAEIRGLFAFCIFKSPINNFNLNKVFPIFESRYVEKNQYGKSRYLTWIPYKDY